MVCDGRLGLVGELAKFVEELIKELIDEFVSELAVVPHKGLTRCRRGKSEARYFAIITGAITDTGSENDVVFQLRHPDSPATTAQDVTFIWPVYLEHWRLIEL